MKTAIAEHRAVELDGWAFKWIVWLLLVPVELRDGRRILCQAGTGYVPWARAALDAFRPHAARWSVPIDDDAS